MSNPGMRWQIVSPNPDATAKFYTRLFDWHVSQDNALGYRRLDVGGAGIDGGVWPSSAEQPPFTQLFVAVSDVEDYVKRALTLGATLLVPVSYLPDGDVMAVLKDPLGLPFGIYTEHER